MRTNALSTSRGARYLWCLIFTVLLLGGVFHALNAHAAP